MIDTKSNIIKYKNYNYLIVQSFPKNILTLKNIFLNYSNIKYPKDIDFSYKLTIENNILTLKELEIHSQTLTPVVLNSVEPIIHKKNRSNCYIYKNLNLPLNYTGNIIISRKYTNEHSSIKALAPVHNIDIKLYFNTGHLTSALTVKEDIWTEDLTECHENFCKYLKKQFVNKKEGVTK